MNHRIFTFIAASLTLIACFTASSAPIPLMSVYQQQLNLDAGLIADSIVAYYLGCILTLVLFCRLSNFFGRKPIVLLTLTLGIVSCLLFTILDSAFILNLARFFQGLACGMASSAAMAWVVDTAPEKQGWLGPVMTAGGPSIGLCIGTLLTGTLTEYAHIEPPLLYTGFICFFVLVGIMVLLSEETVPFGMESLADSLVPKISLPSRLHRLFIVTAGAYVVTWGVGSFFQGFSATMSNIAFGAHSAFLAAVVYLFIQVPHSLAGLSIGRFHAAHSLRILMGVFVLTGIVLFSSLHLHASLIFLGAVIIIGGTNGAICTAALKFLLQDVTLKERASTIAAVYLTAYLGSGIPNFLVGRIAKHLPFEWIGVGYIGWMCIGASGVLFSMYWITRYPTSSEKLRFNKPSQ